jgi:copper chaperone
MTRTFTADGISCDHCKRAIEAEVGALDGVDTVVVDVAARTITVAGPAPDGDVLAAIDRAGYDAVPAPAPFEP